MLRHWSEIENVIQSEPRGKYRGDKVSNHPFFANVKWACQRSQVSPNLFKSWIKDIRKGFICRNIISMDKKHCQEVGYENVSLDARCFIEVIHANSAQ